MLKGCSAERVGMGRCFHRAEHWSVKHRLRGKKKQKKKPINLKAGFQQSHSNSRNNESHPAKVRVRTATLISVLGAEDTWRLRELLIWIQLIYFCLLERPSVTRSIITGSLPKHRASDKRTHHRGATQAHYAELGLTCQHRYTEKKKTPQMIHSLDRVLV